MIYREVSLKARSEDDRSIAEEGYALKARSEDERFTEENLLKKVAQ